MAKVVVNTKPLKDNSSYDWRTGRPNSRPISTVSQPQEPSLAAFLPSKYAFGTVRMRNKSERDKFFNTVRSVMTVRSMSFIEGDDNVFEGEDDENEPTLDFQQIKELPVSMAEKREINARANNEQRSSSRMHTQRKKKSVGRSIRQKWSEFISQFQIWQGDMKKIEGNYGTGVVAYFVFIKWLALLNLFSFVVIFGLIVVPRIFAKDFSQEQLDTSDLDCHNRNNSDEFNNQYIYNMTNNNEAEFIEILQDVVQGTGFMEYTALFYGYYLNENLEAIGYIGAILGVLLVSLFMIIREASKGISYTFHDGDERFYTYCNLIFGGWDFCIANEKAAYTKKVVISNEILGSIEAERLLDERRNRSKAVRNKLIVIRFVLNVIQLAFLVGCGYLILLAFAKSREMLQKSKEGLEDNLQDIERFLYEFLPSITIVCLNMIAPIIFKMLVGFEKYSPNFTLTILLIRTVVLRMASLIVFYASMYMKVKGFPFAESEEIECTDCWETIVGQQIYRLAITDFALHLILTFLVNYPRAVLAEKYNNIKWLTFVCEQTFDLPKHVLDIVYTQMLCWLGIFYAPLLSGMYIIIFFFLFYIKKFACIVNSKPGSIIHRTSRSKFMTILLIAFAVAVFPVLWTVGEQPPSLVCGPFRKFESIWEPITKGFEDSPQWIKDIADYITTIYVGLLLLIILILLISYYIAVKTANNHMTKALKTQLLLEGRDKKFLLEKLSGFLNEQRQVGRTGF